MTSNYFVVAIVKLRLGRFQCPSEFAVRRGLAGIDLRSGRVRQQNNFFARGSLNRIRNIGLGLLLRSIFRLGTCECSPENEGSEPGDHGGS
jgi:hypothetical protein